MARNFSMTTLIVINVILLSSICDGQKPLSRPLNIAHRGCSGSLPEHTAEAYRLAVEQGADIIECDICVTKDLQLVCRHESWLNETTNVWEKENLRSKQMTRTIIDSGSTITDIFTVDLTLEQIQTLGAKQRFEFRNQDLNGQYKIPTLQQCIDIAKNAGRTVGIYPEVKDPKWVNSLDIIVNSNTTIEDLVVDILHKNGYRSKDSPCYIQSFSEESIRMLSTKTQLPLVMLMGPSFPTDEETLKNLSKICYGIGPNKNMIIPIKDNYIQSTSNLIAKAQKYNLKVHPYTFRNEDRFLAWNYTQDSYAEYQQFLEARVDGYFTDFPSSLKRFLDNQYDSNQCLNSANHVRSQITGLVSSVAVLFLLFI